MPKEIFEPNQYQEKIMPLFRNPLKLLKTLEGGHSHTTILYWIPPTDPGDERICDSCKQKAEFLLYDRDHRGYLSGNLFCQNHAHSSFYDYLSQTDI